MSIWRREGAKAFTAGLGVSYLGISEGTLQWVLFEAFNTRLRTLAFSAEEGHTFQSPSWAVIPASVFAKLVATLLTYPHEVEFVFSNRR
jgi:solute carrier family 25, member 33/36